MKNEIVIVIVNNKLHHFKGDELTSPVQQAMILLKKINDEQEAF